MRAAMRKREAIQPRKLYSVDADAFPFAAGSKNQPKLRGWGESAGVRERGEHIRYYMHTWEI